MLCCCGSDLPKTASSPSEGGGFANRRSCRLEPCTALGTIPLALHTSLARKLLEILFRHGRQILGPEEPHDKMTAADICSYLLALTLASAMIGLPAAQQPTIDDVPRPAEVEEALTNERRARNPTFVEYQLGQEGRTLVVGVPVLAQSPEQ